MTNRKIIYLAHPLGSGPDREKNRLNAAKWAAYIAEYFDVAPSCSWVVLSSVWPETEQYRDLGIALDKQMVAQCEEIWLVGGRISVGMQIEADTARELGIPIKDMTYLGYKIPTEQDPLMIPRRPDQRYRDTSVSQQIELTLNSTPGQGGPG